MQCEEDSTLANDGEITFVIPAGGVQLLGDLGASGNGDKVVIFAHGSGSSRLSRRNRQVAEYLRKIGLSTLLFDFLTPAEEAEDAFSGHLRFDIPFLAQRLLAVTHWVKERPALVSPKIGYFGASTGAAAALVAAADDPNNIQAVVSRGGRPDLAAGALPRVKAPTLLIVGGEDWVVIDLNREVLALLTAEKDMFIVPGATHLFEEPGAMDEVSRLAAGWFKRYLVRSE